MKRIFIGIILVAVAVCFFGCSFAGETIVFTDNYLFQGIEEVTVIRVTDLVTNASVSIDDTKIINQLIAMFNDWHPEDNYAEARDLILGFEISFDDKLSIGYAFPGEGTSYYARINTNYYYLPAEFGEYVDDLISNSFLGY